MSSENTKRLSSLVEQTRRASIRGHVMPTHPWYRLFALGLNSLFWLLRQKYSFLLITFIMNNIQWITAYLWIFFGKVNVNNKEKLFITSIKKIAN